MTLEQALMAALGGSPVALVLAVIGKVIWGKYQQALTDINDLHQALHDRDAAELASLRSMATSMGESTDGTGT